MYDVMLVLFDQLIISYFVQPLARSPYSDCLAMSYIICYRVFRKNCVFFHNSLQPIPRLHCCRPSKLSTQCDCTVTPIGWVIFLYNQ